MNNTIFVLEDMEARMIVFEKIAEEAGMNLIHEETVAGARESYLQADPKIVFLDHDLGGRQFVDSEEEETGYTLAKWIKQNDPKYKERVIIIHSANPVGAANIRDALEGNAIILPISSFYRTLKEVKKFFP